MLRLARRSPSVPTLPRRRRGTFPEGRTWCNPPGRGRPRGQPVSRQPPHRHGGLRGESKPGQYRSASYSIKDFDNNGTPDLKVTGSSSKEHVVITEDPVAGTTTLWLDQDANNAQNSKDVVKTFDNSFGSIIVDLSSGDDTLEYYAISSFDEMARSLSLQLGSGNDKLVFDASGEDKGLFTASLHCDIDLSSGNDTASIKMGTVDHSVFRLDLDAGGNNERSASRCSAMFRPRWSISTWAWAPARTSSTSTRPPRSVRAHFFLDIRGGARRRNRTSSPPISPTTSKTRD